MRKILFTFIALLFSVSTAFASNDNTLEFNYWKPSLAGGVKVSSGGVVGTPVDFKGVLGIGDRYVGDFRLITENVLLSYSQFNYSATNQLNTAVQFNGTVYPVNDVVGSSLKIKYYGAVWDTTLNNRPGTAAAITFGARGIQLNGVLSSSSQGSAAKSISLVVPVIGFSVKTTDGPTTFFARVTGLPAGGRGYFFDGEAGVRIAAGKNLMLTAAWRALDINAKKNNDEANIRLSGPYVGAGWSF